MNSYTVPAKVPVLALRNLVVFPQTQQWVRVGREKSLKALKKALESHQWIFLVLQKEPQAEIRGSEDLLRTGTLCRIETSKGSDSEGYQILIRGVELMEVVGWEESSDLLEARLQTKKISQTIHESLKVDFIESIKNLYKEARVFQRSLVSSHEPSFLDTQNLDRLVFGVSQALDFDLRSKQKILEAGSDQERVLLLLQLLSDFRDQGKIKRDLQDKLSASISEAQKQHLLREQLKIIKDELGESGEDHESLSERLSKKKLPSEAMKFAQAQLKKLQTTPPQSPDYHVIKNHLDFLLDLPWEQKIESVRAGLNKEGVVDSNSLSDLEVARKILDEDHFGMERVKKRILESLAARKLKNRTEGTVLLLVGPPGVGKTSLARSLAKSMSREYVRVSLGGVRDEAEIRGHRRTYVGALPGRILAGMKKVSSIDPVFVLDEIDKLNRSYSGDPSAALLEVLDPEQNHSFSDHYLETPYDLSKVFFVCTANSVDTIPSPLLDRMEVIDLGSYSTEEKVEIARRHLFPQLMNEFGLGDRDLQLAEGVIKTLIQKYTREAGVRDLKRKLESLIRALAEKILSAREVDQSLFIEISDLEKYLGPSKYRKELYERRSIPGVVTGLAWSPGGGDILTIETALVPGEGKTILTGQLGEVMKESVQIALTHLRARLQTLTATRPLGGGDEGGASSPAFRLAQLNKYDLHIHIPSGAIPKEGPSAGITLLSALASLFLDRPLEGALAMTGEVTLRGVVLPVGGIKEKVLAAHRAGIQKVILPSQNKRDLEEVPISLRNEMKFYFVDSVDEVLKFAFAEDPPLLPSTLGPKSSFTVDHFTE